MHRLTRAGRAEAVELPIGQQRPDRHRAAQQRSMAERAGSTVTEVDAGHLSLITRPDEVTAVIVDAVKHVSA